MYIIINDFGTSSVKTCLFEIDSKIKLVASASAGYCLYISETGRRIETVNNSQEVGVIGTALVVAAGIQNTDVLKLAKELVKCSEVYTPNPDNKEVYDRNYQIFKNLYQSNRKNFRGLNR